ncbi:alpha/beta fold hydrolase [Sorangium sp. So ce134]
MFLAHQDDDPDRRKPLLIYLSGSGARSHFVMAGDEIDAGRLGAVASVAASRFHVFGLEKRGVSFLDSRPGSADGASPEYHRHATLEGRVEEVRTFLDAALAEEAIDPGRVVLVGHSEGADVAAAAAAADPRVTHAVFLCGGGPTQLFDLVVLLRKRLAREGRTPEDVELAVQAMERAFRRILASPEDTVSMFMGHAYRRWASFARSPPVANLLKTRARLFVAHGTEDTSVPIESFDLLTVELLRLGREATLRRYPGRDHGLSRPGASPAAPAMLDVFQEVVAWALEG